MSKPPLHIAITYQPKSMTEQKPPLWKMMHKAHNAVADPLGAAALAAYAAEIRAVRDWLFPEHCDLPVPARSHESGDVIRSEQSQRLRALLTAEADRAERGEVEP